MCGVKEINIHDTDQQVCLPCGHPLLQERIFNKCIPASLLTCQSSWLEGAISHTGPESPSGFPWPSGD